MDHKQNGQRCSYAEVLNIGLASVTQIADRSKKKSNDKDLQPLPIAHQKESDDMYYTLKEMQNQLTELEVKIVMLSTKLKGLGIPKDNGVIRPNKGGSSVISDGPNEKIRNGSKGTKKVGSSLVSLSRHRQVCQVKRRSRSSTFKVGST